MIVIAYLLSSCFIFSSLFATLLRQNCIWDKMPPQATTLFQNQVQIGTIQNYCTHISIPNSRERWKPSCSCSGDDKEPHYIQLGASGDRVDLVKLVESRFPNQRLKWLQVKYTKKRATTRNGCTQARYIISRQDEDVLVLYSVSAFDPSVCSLLPRAFGNL